MSDASQIPADSIAVASLPDARIIARWPGVDLLLVRNEQPAEERALAEQVARRALRDTPFNAPAYTAADADAETRVFIARQQGVAVGLTVLRPRARWAWWSWDDWDEERRPSTGVAPMVAWTVEGIWIHAGTQHQGLARRILVAASEEVGVPITSFGWRRPFTPSGEALVRRLCPEGFWVPD